MTFLGFNQEDTIIFQLQHVEKSTESLMVRGWIRHRRELKKHFFVELTDGTSDHLQLVFDRALFPELTGEQLKERTSLEVEGEFVKSPAKGQDYEMQVRTYKILGTVHSDYPIGARTELTMDYLRQHPSLRIHTETFKAIRRIRSAAYQAMNDFYSKTGFTYVDEPFLTESACEGGCAPLQVTSLLEGKDGKKEIDYTQDFFRKPVYLTVSAQLHLECDALALGNVYTWTRAFRGEQSQTIKHCAEFTMLEHEMCFTTLTENYETIISAIKKTIGKILKYCHKDVEFLEAKQRSGLKKTLISILEEPFVISSHEECVKAMLEAVASRKAVFDKMPSYEDDLSSEHEKYIVDVLYGGKPVVVRYFPAAVKAFYMPLMADGKHVDCFDILFPRVGEIVGGSQRETNYETLEHRVKALSLDPEPLQFYLDLRKYGTVPHGGMGLGFDRLVMFLTGTDNIRDVVSFPRAYRLCDH